MELIVQSHCAFIAIQNDLHEEDRMARVINQEIVSDSESSSVESVCDDVKSLIKKKRLAVRRQVRRLRVKAVNEARFLCRGITPRASKILQDCPRIGEVIEEFVKEHNVGADAWQRTGVLTFDRNANLKCKVTYEKIRQHLEGVFGRSFSYGTVVELCIPCNHRRRSAVRYQGLAKVATRRAR